MSYKKIISICLLVCFGFLSQAQVVTKQAVPPHNKFFPGIIYHPEHGEDWAAPTSQFARYWAGGPQALNTYPFWGPNNQQVKMDGSTIRPVLPYKWFTSSVTAPSTGYEFEFTFRFHNARLNNPSICSASGNKHVQAPTALAVEFQFKNNRRAYYAVNVDGWNSNQSSAVHALNLTVLSGPKPGTKLNMCNTGSYNVKVRIDSRPEFKELVDVSTQLGNNFKELPAGNNYVHAHDYNFGQYNHSGGGDNPWAGGGIELKSATFVDLEADPAPPTIISVDGDTTAPFNSNKKRPAVVVGAQPGTTVSIPNYSCTTVTAAGQSTCTPDADLAEGGNVIPAPVVTTANGRSTTGNPSAVEVDSVAPATPTVVSVDGDTAAPFLTNNKRPPVVYSAEDGSTVAVPGYTCSPTPVTGSQVTCTPDADLADGPNTVPVPTATDPAGNTADGTATPVTVDTTAPTAPTVASVDGDATAPFLTNNKRPPVEFNAEDGTVVTVPGYTCPTAPVTGGKVTCTPDADLVDGANTVPVPTATDPAGNTTDGSTTPITVDATAPTAPTVASVDGDTTAPFLTNNKRPPIEFNAEDGTVVTVPGYTCPTAPVTGGKVTCTPNADLVDGANAVPAPTATDPAGNTADGTPTPVTVDTAAPTAPTVASVDGDTTAPFLTNNKRPPVEFNAEDGTVVTVPGYTCPTAPVTGGKVTCTPDADLAEGPNTVPVPTATDPAGNTADGTTTPVTVDTTGPTAPTVASVDGDATAPFLTNNKRPPVEFNAEDGTVVTVPGYTCPTSPVTGGKVTCTPDADLADGPNTVPVPTATDPAGNTADGTATPVTVDTAAPTAPTVASVDGDTTAPFLTNNKRPPVEFNAEDGTVVTVPGYTCPTTPVTGGKVTCTPDADLADGPNTVPVPTATDPAGNTADGTATPVTVDTAAPTAPTVASVDGDATAPFLTNNKRPPVEFNAEDGTVVTVPGYTCPTAPVTGGKVTCTPDADLAEGPNTVPVPTATDPAGNTADGTTTPVTVDTTGPTAPTVASVDGDTTAPFLTNNKRPPVEFNAEDGTVVTVPGYTCPTTPVTGGKVTCTPDADLADGPNTVPVPTATDPAGNTTDGTTTPVTVDTAAPTAPTVASVDGDTTAPFLTNNKRPPVEFNAEDGTVVTVPGYTCPTAPVTGGKVTCTPDADLAEGPNTVPVPTATDPAGNTVDGPTTPVTVDTTAPTAPTVVSVDGDTTAPFLTNNKKPPVVYAAEDGSTVAVPGYTCSPTPVTGGQVTCTPDADLADGPNTVPVPTATDPAGNTTDGTATPVTVDATAPTIPTVASVDGDTTAPFLTNNKRPPVEFNAEDGTVVTVPGYTCPTAPVTGGKVTCTPDADLAEGPNTVPVPTATDPAGNTVDGPTTPVTVDTTAPTSPTVVSVDGDTTAPFLTNNKKPPVVYAAEDGSTVAVPGYTCSPTPVTGGQVTCTPDADLADGPNTVPVPTATDPAGNTTDGTATPVTVDATAPTIPTVASVDGDTTAPFLTNNKRPPVEFNAEDGTVVTVPGYTCPTAPVTGGKVTCTPDADLAEGQNTVPVPTATDPAGNTVDGPTTPVTVDTTAPTAPTVVSVDGDTTAPFLTNNKKPPVVYAAEDGSTVAVPGYTCSPTPVTGGQVTCTPDADLADGPNTVPVPTATDPAGNTTDGTATPVTVDATAPTIPTVASVDGDTTAPFLTNNKRPPVEFNAEDGTVVTVPGYTCPTAPVTGGKVTCTPDADLADGPNTVPVPTATDPAGNTVDGPTTPVTVDTTAPTAPTVVSVDGDTTAPFLTNNKKPPVVYAAEDGSTVVVPGYTCSPTPVTGGQVTCTPDADLADGPNTVPVPTATDPAGNTTDGTATPVTVDATAPTIPTVASVDGDTTAPFLTNNKRPPVEFNAEDGTVVTVPGYTCPTAPVTGGKVTCTPDADLAEGPNTVPVPTATDPAGNTVDGPTTPVTVDTTAPTAPTVVSVDGDTTAPFLTNNKKPPVVYAAEDGSTVAVPGYTCSPTPVTGGQVTCTPDADLADGPNTVPVPTATDPAGNTTDGTATPVTVDATAPTIPTVASVDGDTTAPFLTNNKRPPVEFNAEDGTVVTVPGYTCPTAPVTGGKVTCTPDADLADGPNTVPVPTATDPAGNTTDGTTTPITVIGVIDPTNSSTTVVADPTSIEADGVSTSTITLTAADANGNRVTTGGATVTFALNPNNGTLSNVTDNNDGTYTATLTSSTTPGTVTVTAIANGAAVTDTATVDFTIGAASATKSTVTASRTSIVADGIETSTIIVQTKDANDNNLTVGGATVTLALNPNNGTLSSVTDNNDGTYTATLTSSTAAGRVTVNATLNNVAVTDNATVTYISGAPSARGTVVSASPTSIEANGVSTSMITVDVKDAFGNNVTTSANTVTLDTNIGTLSNVTNNGDGTYTATLTSATTAGTARVTATLDGAAVGDDASVVFTVGAPDATNANTTLVANPPSIKADGTDTSTITLTVSDSQGNRVTKGGDTVSFNTNLGSIVSVRDNNDGTYTATLRSSNSAGTATVTASLNNQLVTNTATVQFTAGTPSPTNVNTTIIAKPDSIEANGQETSTVTLTVADANGNRITSGGATVVFASTSGSLGNVTDNGDGTYSAVLTSSTTVGTATVTATLDGVAVTNNETVAFTSGTGSTGNTKVTLSPDSIVADGQETSTVTLTVFDANGNRLTTGGSQVRFNATSGSLGNVTDNGDGTYTAVLTSPTTSGTATVTATLDGTAVANPATITFVAGNATQIASITASQQSVIANNQQEAIITVILSDANDNRVTVGGDTVTLATTLGTLSSVIDNNDGSYTATLKASNVGRARVTATLTPKVRSGQITQSSGQGIILKNTVTIDFVAGAPTTGSSLISVDNLTIEANGTSTSTVTVELRDANGNRVTQDNGETITLATTLGTLGSVTNNGNGTFTATFTSATAPGRAIITGRLNGNPIVDDATVQMVTGGVSAAQTTVTATPTSITANSTSTSTIVVQAKDANGNNLTTGGATVALSTTLGTLSNVTDNGDGTYTATLTSPDTGGTATISATVDGTAVTDTATVTLVSAITATATPNQDGTATTAGTSSIPGSTVTITYPSGETVTVTADNNGNYTGTSTNPQSSGDVTVTAVGPNNQKETVVVPLVDNVAPGQPTVTVTKESDNRAKVTGKAEPGSTVTVTYPDGTTTTATADASGNYTAVSTNPQTESGDVTVVAKDANGNESIPVTVAFTLSDEVEVTQRVIADYLGARNSALLNSQPELQRRIDRLKHGTDDAYLRVGSLEVEGVTLREDLLAHAGISRSDVSFNTSTNRLSETNANWDAWIEAQFSGLDGEKSNGSFGIIHTGVDYKINDNALVGLSVQYDSLRQDGEGSNASQASGQGWMIGPYGTIRLSDELFLDGRAAWGRSSNEVSPTGTYEDSFSTDRFLVSAALIGDYQLDNWNIRPALRVQYIEENQDDYISSNGVAIPGQTVSQGDVRFGPRISYNYANADGSVISPWIQLEGVYTYTESGNQSNNSFSEDLDGLSGSIGTGFDYNYSNGVRFSVSGDVNGLGTDSLDYGANMNLMIPFK